METTVTNQGLEYGMMALDIALSIVAYVIVGLTIMMIYKWRKQKRKNAELSSDGKLKRKREFIDTLDGERLEVVDAREAVR